MKSKFTPLTTIATVLSVGSFVLTTLAICYGNYSLSEMFGWNSCSFGLHAALLWFIIGIASGKIK